MLSTGLPSGIYTNTIKKQPTHVSFISKGEISPIYLGLKQKNLQFCSWFLGSQRYKVRVSSYSTTNTPLNKSMARGYQLSPLPNKA